MSRRNPFDRSRLTDPEPIVDFIAALVDVQGAQTDASFVAELGVSIWLWRKVRKGTERLGMKLWMGGAEMVNYRIAKAAYDCLMEKARARGNAVKKERAA